MSDLVERLRVRKRTWLEAIEVMEEAANYIERIRAETIEECARVCDTAHHLIDNAIDLARHIRALKDKP